MFEEVAQCAHGARADRSNRGEQYCVHPVLSEQTGQLTGFWFVARHQRNRAHEGVVKRRHRADEFVTHQVFQAIPLVARYEAKARELAGLLRKDGVDAVLLTPV